jgi:predicted RNase H-like nuclease (RuvC/YqgF family)
MRRLEERLFAITDEIASLREAIRQTQEELIVHQHLHDDAVRDASVGGPIEREDARETTRDVTRFQRLITELRERVDRLEAKRDRLLERFGSTG